MDFSIEIKHGMADGKWIVGVDEVGRGPIAGPVLAAAVVFPPDILLKRNQHKFINEIKDSKIINAKKRSELAYSIKKYAFFALGAASVEEINRHNILQASLRAMKRACVRLEKILTKKKQGQAIHSFLIDGIHTPKLDIARQRIQAIVKGDNKSISVACAAIVAKVTRDHLMQKLHAQYPLYAWLNNKGYPVPKHINAIEKDGLSPHHRKTFAPCTKIIKNTNL